MINIKLNDKTILITGVAGFIGSFLAETLLQTIETVKVIGVDNLNDYYDVQLKETRLKLLKDKENFRFIRASIADKNALTDIFNTYRPEIVVNLAAQAGVRYSITNPDCYITSNIIGFYNILEACRSSYKDGQKGVAHLVYASSSSVYGTNEKVPYSTEDKVDTPVSLYAATKKSNELMAYAYSKLYKIPTTGLRFFTVYGPTGRPDMAYFGFTDKLIRGEKIQLFNYGNMKRDFTYIDDIITGIMAVLQKAPDKAEEDAPCRIYNIGNHKPVSLLCFVETLEKCLREEGLLDKEVEKEFLPMQPGDVYQTYADVDALERDFGFRPDTRLEDGLRKFVKWYKSYYINEQHE